MHLQTKNILKKLNTYHYSKYHVTAIPKDMVIQVKINQTSVIKKKCLAPCFNWIF